MRIHSLYLYPVKSLAGIQVDSFAMDEFGPAGDRRWMIVDDERRFVTQRNYPQLARINAFFSGARVEVDIPGEGAFSLQPTGETLPVLVWRDWVKARVGNSEASEALSRFCGQRFRFVYMPEETFRRIDADRVGEYRRVGFADGFPFLITNLASLDELNGRLEKPVEMRRFRPNIVVEGAEPWVEDDWRELQIGARQFRLVKPCSRCIMTTVDPDRGVKDPAAQPLRTLTGYRRTDEGVIFGMNAVHDQPGKIRVGDPVSIVKTEIT
ncbi:MOSC domain-containing protein [Marinobacter pelagius]|uniref:MOSC domain-containing protein n=1 Tax=Marinobacter sp. C7 TaxID=2951363 RepID=UPI001EF142D5|nr:MOSC N-terminal beta barrel domain-containing protein [Marinobacter sp. C7]MCG7199804.1 MOSC domain-containing protein [Marinobacter sp. C7]